MRSVVSVKCDCARDRHSARSLQKQTFTGEYTTNQQADSANLLHRWSQRSIAPRGSRGEVQLMLLLNDSEQVYIHKRIPGSVNVAGVSIKLIWTFEHTMT